MPTSELIKPQKWSLDIAFLLLQVWGLNEVDVKSITMSFWPDSLNGVMAC